MRKLISFTLFLSLTGGLFLNLSNWLAIDFEKPSMNAAIDSKIESAITTNFMMMPTVSIRDTFVIEGNLPDMPDTLLFVVDRGDNSTGFMVNYTTRNGTAYHWESDYSLTTGSLAFALGGALTDTIKIPVIADNKTELDETMSVVLFNINNATALTMLGDSVATGTIINNDTSYLSIRDTMIVEGDTGTDSLRFVVDMIGELDTMFLYSFMTMDSSATVTGGDYLFQSGMSTGSGTGTGTTFLGIDTLAIGINGDTKTELDEQVKVLFSNINAFGRSLLFMSDDSLSVGTIKNEDTTQISIQDVMKIEGNTGIDTMKFIVSVDKPVDSLGIVFMTMDSTASAITDTDYVALVTDTFYMHCTTTDTLKIAVKGDETVELGEFFKVKLLEILPSNRTVIFLDSIAVGTIINDDTASISIRDTFLVEGDIGVDSLKFVVTTNKLVDSLKVVFMSFDSTASIADNDYEAVFDTLCITGFSDTIKIPVINDTKTELNEFLKISLIEILPGNRAVFSVDSTAVGTIINNDTSYLSIRDTMVVEGDTGTDSLRFVVDMTGELDTMFLYSFMTMDSSATVAGGDYLFQSGISTGRGTGTGSVFLGIDTLTIGINGDTKTELDEQLKVMFSNINAFRRTLLFMNDDSLSVGTIKNEDTTQISIQNAMLIEGNMGIDTMKFIVSVDKPVDSLGIVFMTMDSTASAVTDTDYVAVVKDTFYMHCSITDTIKIVIKGDKTVELDDLFKVKLIEILPGNRTVTFLDSIGVGTIINDDTARISINDVVMEEGDIGTTAFVFTVTLDSDLDSMLLVDFATCDSTATLADADYIANSGTLNFAGTANETKTITVNVIGNGYVEIDEVFNVKLSNIIAGGLSVIFADSVGAGRIQNDDFDPTIIDPCDCLKNQSSPSAKDGQFAETISVSSQAGETWYIASVNGLYQKPFGAFPPAKNGNPYPLIPFNTGIAGQQLTVSNLGIGLSNYSLQGIHVDDLGYIITVTNGMDSLTIGNTCHYEKACNADQTVVIPFFPKVAGQAKIDDCTADNKFINDGIHLYRDSVPRFSEITICPAIKGQILTASFQAFDLAIGDTLWVYDGQDTSANFIAKGSGNSVSNFNGAWVSSNCDPNINPSGCLTFVFTTNGNNNKGAGWEATLNCTLQGVTTLNPINDIYASAKCDSLKRAVNLRIPTINRSSTDCLLANDSIIVSYCDIRDTFKAGELTYPVFPFGTHIINYKLLVDTTITASNKVHVSIPSLACNDTVITAIGQGCITVIQPDDILEGTCDTNGVSFNKFYIIKVQTDTGLVIGTAPNYPILNASKGGNVTCNTFYKVTVVRTLQTSYNGCDQSVIDSCSGTVKLIDGIKPVFVKIKKDTIYGCHDMTLTQNMLTQPTVIDNCEIDKLVASFPSNPTENCAESVNILVSWTATDLCGNTTLATQNVTIIRPNTLNIPNDTIVDCTVNITPNSIGWPKIDSDGDNVGDLIITDKKTYCNFELSYTDEIIRGTCGSNFNILRKFRLFDNCANISDPIFIDTQYILIRDTIAPIVNCPTPSVFGSKSNPYYFRTAYNSCTGLPGKIYPPTGTDACDADLTAIILGVYKVKNNVLVATSLTIINPLELGEYRVAYVLKDDCGNTSKICNIYFNIIDQTLPTAICTDELVVSLSNGNLIIRPEDISNGTFDACGIDTMLIRRSICGNENVYPTDTNFYVAGKFLTFRDANAWSSSIEIGCCDMNNPIKVQLLVFDKGGNYNKCWLTISPENQPQAVCGNLPDAEGFCDDYATNQIGKSTDTNLNKAFDDAEWQPIDSSLLDIINTQFGNPACNTNVVCVNTTIEQEYQLLKQACGVQTMKRRFRTRGLNGQSNYHPWYEQNILIKYRPGWSFTFPPDTIIQCGMSTTGNIPEMPLIINRGSCDQIGWEVKDEKFETADASCFKILRKWFVINGCQHSDVQQPFQLPRDQFGGQVTQNSKRTFTSTDSVGGIALNTQGYFTYTQLIIVMDNEAPIITIAEVDTCIYGVPDAAPFNQSDQTPGAFPYECDTVRLFSATGMDCTPSNLLDFRYEVFDEGVRVSFGAGNYIYHVVQPNRTYRVRFTASDNCGNIGSTEKTYRFRDCRKPTALCESITIGLDNNQLARVSAKAINSKSYDNCTDSTNLDLRIWHSSLGPTAPTNLTEVLALPTYLTLNCQNRGTSIANLYVIDQAQNYDFCSANITIEDNLNGCPNLRPIISGSIQTVDGDMVEQVQVLITGNGEMPKMITTNSSGLYKYEVEKGTDYTVSPKKDINPLNGVSTYDLVLMQQHILGIKIFDSPYNYIAADVNQSKAVTAYDMVILRQLILNILRDFPNNESWKFVSTAYPMEAPNPLIADYHEYHSVSGINSSITADFMAVKIGDINGNAQPNSFLASQERNFSGSLDFHLTNRQIESGKTYILDFSAKDLGQILGYQFTLQFEGLIFENWDGGLIDDSYFGYSLSERGFITASWNRKDKVKLPQKEALFKLKFTANQDGLLSDMLSINSKYTEAEGYDSESQLLGVQLVFDKAKINQKEFELYQNRPNPFKEQTQISFYLPEDSKTILTILDITGKVIKTINGSYKKGNHSITLTRNDLPTSGVLYYQLQSSAGKMTKTMLVLD